MNISIVLLSCPKLLDVSAASSASNPNWIQVLEESCWALVHDGTGKWSMFGTPCLPKIESKGSPGIDGFIMDIGSSSGIARIV